MQAGAVEALQGVQRVRAEVRPPLRVAQPVRRRRELPQLPSLFVGEHLFLVYSSEVPYRLCTDITNRTVLLQ